MRGYGLLKQPSYFLKAVFHKFYFVYSWILCPIWNFYISGEGMSVSRSTLNSRGSSQPLKCPLEWIFFKTFVDKILQIDVLHISSELHSRCRYIFKGSTYKFFGCLFKIYFKNINFDRIGFTNLTLATSYFKGLSEKWLVASFLRFDNQTFKVWKTAWIQNYCLCILTLYPNTGPLKFWHVCCCHVFFFCYS